MSSFYSNEAWCKLIAAPLETSRSEGRDLEFERSFPWYRPKMILTLGVPTYNRVEHISRLLGELLSAEAMVSIEILVVDDGSADRTYEVLTADTQISSSVRLLKNEVNLGYPKTFARMFQECDTDYLMLVADNDRVNVEQLAPLIEYLEDEQPTFVSTQFMQGSTMYRGRKVSRAIKPSEFWSASGHAPGLVYRVERCHTALDVIAARVDADLADVLIYPQVALLAQLMVAGEKCDWVALPVVSEGASEPSGIRDSAGRGYWLLESRWQQFRAFEELLTGLAQKFPGEVSQMILEAHRKRIFPVMSKALRLESPSLGAAFDSGARKAFESEMSTAKLEPADAELNDSAAKWNSSVNEPLSSEVGIDVPEVVSEHMVTEESSPAGKGKSLIRRLANRWKG